MERTEGVEIYSHDVDMGTMKIEISVHDVSGKSSLENDLSHPDGGYHVYLTARDSNLRRIWTTPVKNENGQVKSYGSIDQAIQDVIKRLDVLDTSLGQAEGQSS